jgi:hypothetical protein
MLRFCLDVVLQVCSPSPSRHELFLSSISLGHGSVLDQVITSANAFYSPSSAQNSVTEFETQNVIKFYSQSILYV